MSFLNQRMSGLRLGLDINIALPANYIMQEMSFEKVVFLGDSGVGKSKLLEALTSSESVDSDSSNRGEGGFVSSPPAKTMMQYKNLRLADNKAVQLWDSEEYRRPGVFRKIYLQRTRAYIITFDVCRATSFSNCSLYLDMVNDSKAASAQVLLVGIRKSTSERQVSSQEAEEWCTANNCFYLETDGSASIQPVLLSKLQEVLEKAAMLE